MRGLDWSGTLTGLRAAWRREISADFATPLAYVFVAIFLLVLGVFTWDLSRFFDTGAADLAPRPAGAAGKLRAGCDADDVRACFKLGQLLRDGRVSGAAPGEGDEQIERACREGHSAACDALGH